jgi:uncharacterized protein (TIGR03435 family)
MFVRTLSVGALLVACVAGVHVSGHAAQNPASEARFEVASVKLREGQSRPSPPPIPATSLVRRGGVFHADFTVASLVQFAYDLRDFQVLGGPDWIRQDGFEINARAGFDPTPEQVRLMVRSLLKERFRLTTHSERRDMRFLALVLARDDRRLGPYIRAT